MTVAIAAWLAAAVGGVTGALAVRLRSAHGSMLLGALGGAFVGRQAKAAASVAETRLPDVLARLIGNRRRQHTVAVETFDH